MANNAVAELYDNPHTPSRPTTGA